MNNDDNKSSKEKDNLMNKDLSQFLNINKKNNIIDDTIKLNLTDIDNQVFTTPFIGEESRQVDFLYASKFIFRT
jgi:hypothetical protein